MRKSKARVRLKKEKKTESLSGNPLSLDTEILTKSN